MTEAAKEARLKLLHEGVRAYCAKLPPEEKAERGRKAGAINTSKSVHAQWASIRKHPAKMEALRKQRSSTFSDNWTSLTPEERSSRTLKRVTSDKRSRVASDFLREVEGLGFFLDLEVPISGFLVDALYTPTRTVIEFYGDFWHCHPKRYPDPDWYHPWLKRTVRQQWSRDSKRLGVFYSLGYQVVVVWECDWLQSKDSVLQRVAAALKA